MTAVDIFKQSLSFYGRLFNKIFWISLASTLVPHIFLSGADSAQPALLPLLMVAVLAMFLSVYMMAFIHQFSDSQDDSLSSAFKLALNKVMPVMLTSFVLGLLVMLAVLPGAILGTILAASINDEVLRNTLMAICIAIPVAVVMYRCFFAAYFTLVDGLNPIEALKASNQQVKGNKLVFRGLTLLSFAMLGYIILLALTQLMIAVNPVVQAFLEGVLNVLFMPFMSVFIYRLFTLSKQPKTSVDEEV